MLTKRQKQALDFIKSYSEKKGYSPSLEEIKRHLRLSSVSTAHHHVKALEDLGYLRKEDNQPRAIDVFKEEQLVTIQMAGTIAAGQPIESLEEKETIAIPKSAVLKKGKLFALRVSGNSMIDENIYDGDVIIVRQQWTAENGQKVVALINGTESTLKKFFRDGSRIRLQPANMDFSPIFVQPSQLDIQGVVIDVVRNENTADISKVLKQKNNQTKKSKGSCILEYDGKTPERIVLTQTPNTKLLLEKKVGISDKNKLIYGDNLNVLKNLSEDPSVRGKIDLIYIDPPYGTGQEFTGYDESNRYSDELINAEFLEFLRQRLIFLRELLAETGSIYLHIDLKIGHYVKLIMDEVFGEKNFRNDITRIKCNPKNFDRKAFGNIKDVIYFYSKTKPNGNDLMLWNDYRIPLLKEEILHQFPKIDKHGQRYATTPLHAKGETRNGPTGQKWKGLNPPKGRHWRYAPEELTRLDKAGLIEWSPTGNPRKIIYAEQNRGKKIQDVWDFKDPGYESSLYPTEKNLGLLKQIILTSSKKNGLVLDCFAGSGTTLVAAQELNRNWIGIDLHQSAVKTAERRLNEVSKKNGLFSKPVSYSVFKSTYKE